MKSRAIFLFLVFLTAIYAVSNFSFLKSEVSGKAESLKVAFLNYEKTITREEKKISLAFVGDIMLDRGVKSVIQKHGGGDYNYPFILITPFLKSFDFVFANLEGPVSQMGVNRGSIYSFRMSPDSAQALRSANFGIVSVANNHIGDWGEEAMKDTLDFLTKDGVHYAGGGMNQYEAYSPRIVNIKGTKIAFLAFSQFGAGYTEAIGNKIGIAVIDTEKIKRSIAVAVNGSDVVVVSYHFGDEYKKEPNDFQKKFARLAIDSGADIVIGHHPHVVEPVEKYLHGYIAYSLGNFVFDQNFSKETIESFILEADIEDNSVVGLKKHPVKINSFFQPELAGKPEILFD